VDSLGNVWWIQAHVEDAAPDEIARRMNDPEWLQRMAYVQSSLPAAIR
jgi:hypothetical protein